MKLLLINDVDGKQWAVNPSFVVSLTENGRTDHLRYTFLKMSTGESICVKSTVEALRASLISADAI